MRVGVEGTGSYGAGLARLLASAGVEVVEVDRPNRQLRRRQGKTDTLDAIEAARAAQSGRAVGRAKSRDGNVEAIRALVVAKRSGRTAKTKSLNQMRHLGFTAPNALRQRPRHDLEPPTTTSSARRSEATRRSTSPLFPRWTDRSRAMRVSHDDGAPDRCTRPWRSQRERLGVGLYGGAQLSGLDELDQTNGKSHLGVEQRKMADCNFPASPAH